MPIPLHFLLLFLSVCSQRPSSSQPFKYTQELPKCQRHVHDHCDDIQELACIDPDACDSCAVAQFGGRCRNSNDPNETCLPENNPCDEDDTGGKSPGRCLENTFCAPGRHAMPHLGTPKSLKCLSVKDLKAGEVIIYRNIDYTGDSCLVQSDGVWATPGDQSSLSVDSSPGSANPGPCRKSGEAETGPVDTNTCPADAGADNSACTAPVDTTDDAKYPTTLYGTQDPVLPPNMRRRSVGLNSVPRSKFVQSLSHVTSRIIQV